MDMLDIYYKEIREEPFLTPDEEVELGRRVQAGDEAARQRMIRANLCLVVTIARQFQYLPMALLDIVAEGNFGLMRAVEKWDPERGLRFSTYAVHWIKQTIRRGAQDKYREIRLPAHSYEYLNRYNKYVLYYQEHNAGEDPSFDDVVKTLELTNAQGRLLKDAIAAYTTSMDRPIDMTGNPLATIVADISAPEPTDLLESKDYKRVVGILMKSLNPRERQAVKLRFGFDGADAMTLREVAGVLGVSPQRTQQILRKVFAKMADLAIRERYDVAV